MDSWLTNIGICSPPPPPPAPKLEGPSELPPRAISWEIAANPISDPNDPEEMDEEYLQTQSWFYAVSGGGQFANFPQLIMYQDFQNWMRDEIVTIEELREVWIQSPAVDDFGYTDFQGFIEYLGSVVDIIDKKTQEPCSMFGNSNERQTEYDVHIPFEKTLGMLLERHKHPKKRTALNKVGLVVAGAAAEKRGVKVGSYLVRINGQSLDDKEFDEVLKMLKTTKRPMTLHFVLVETVPPGELNNDYQIVRSLYMKASNNEECISLAQAKEYIDIKQWLDEGLISAQRVNELWERRTNQVNDDGKRDFDSFLEFLDDVEDVIDQLENATLYAQQAAGGQAAKVPASQPEPVVEPSRNIGAHDTTPAPTPKELAEPAADPRPVPVVRTKKSAEPTPEAPATPEPPVSERVALAEPARNADQEVPRDPTTETVPTVGTPAPSAPTEVRKKLSVGDLKSNVQKASNARGAAQHTGRQRSASDDATVTSTTSSKKRLSAADLKNRIKFKAADDATVTSTTSSKKRLSAADLKNRIKSKAAAGNSQEQKSTSPSYSLPQGSTVVPMRESTNTPPQKTVESKSALDSPPDDGSTSTTSRRPSRKVARGDIIRRLSVKKQTNQPVAPATPQRPSQAETNVPQSAPPGPPQKRVSKSSLQAKLARTASTGTGGDEILESATRGGTAASLPASIMTTTAPRPSQSLPPKPNTKRSVSSKSLRDSLLKNNMEFTETAMRVPIGTA